MVHIGAMDMSGEGKMQHAGSACAFNEARGQAKGKARRKTETRRHGGEQRSQRQCESSACASHEARDREKGRQGEKE